MTRGFQKGNKLGVKFGKKEKHPNWNGGVQYYTSGSNKVTYRRVRVGNEYIPEHRYVMEKQLGRKLRKDEIVHHIDHNGLNNNISNLKLMDYDTHNKEHGINRRKYPDGFTCTCGSDNFHAKGLCKKCYLREWYISHK